MLHSNYAVLFYAIILYSVSRNYANSEIRNQNLALKIKIVENLNTISEAHSELATNVKKLLIGADHGSQNPTALPVNNGDPEVEGIIINIVEAIIEDDYNTAIELYQNATSPITSDQLKDIIKKIMEESKSYVKNLFNFFDGLQSADIQIIGYRHMIDEMRLRLYRNVPIEMLLASRAGDLLKLGRNATEIQRINSRYIRRKLPAIVYELGRGHKFRIKFLSNGSLCYDSFDAVKLMGDEGLDDSGDLCIWHTQLAGDRQSFEIINVDTKRFLQSWSDYIRCGPKLTKDLHNKDASWIFERAQLDINMFSIKNPASNKYIDTEKYVKENSLIIGSYNGRKIYSNCEIDLVFDD